MASKADERAEMMQTAIASALVVLSCTLLLDILVLMSAVVTKATCI